MKTTVRLVRELRLLGLAPRGLNLVPSPAILHRQLIHLDDPSDWPPDIVYKETLHSWICLMSYTECRVRRI